ncbi:superoxide dismutase family protein [Altererythrobacter endophyticus]|uniref:Superoxide dismutase [Cu-Zn] n=2 Tax=Altericroceibacterium endophyticum TaxID=1808508 RepID=A0A6I4T6R2_9SPHN|nr:superoxide dismutase family protein [Altericroceibacterium endophyticum]
MSVKALLAIAPLPFALAACQTMGNPDAGRLAEATLYQANGLPAGTAQIYRAGDEARITVALAGLPEGKHGLHLHTVGSCIAPDFKSAGGHLNPEDHEHGSLNPQGKHLGDLPNIDVAANGTGTISATLSEPAAEAMRHILDSDGTAIVVHAGADDYKTDPAGDAGARIACGEVTAV